MGATFVVNITTVVNLSRYSVYLVENQDAYEILSETRIDASLVEDIYLKV